MATKTYDVLIIGAGHNGLVAATYLAKAGKKVLVLEANAEIGGATASVRVFPMIFPLEFRVRHFRPQPSTALVLRTC